MLLRLDWELRDEAEKRGLTLQVAALATAHLVAGTILLTVVACRLL